MRRATALKLHAVWSSCPRNGQRPGLSGSAQGLSWSQVTSAGRAKCPLQQSSPPACRSSATSSGTPSSTISSTTPAALARREGEADAARRSRGQHHRRAAEQLGPQDPPLQPRAPLHDQGGADHSRHRCCRRRLIRARHRGACPRARRRARHRRRRHRRRLWAVRRDERGAWRLVRLRRRRPHQVHRRARLRAHAPCRARR